MSNESTIKMLAAYNQEASPTMFLSGMFKSPPRNFHTSEDVEIDIVRSEEEVAIAISDLSTGYHDNSNDIYTNKRFKPPIFKEKIVLNAFDMINRQPGIDPFQDPQYQADAIVKAFAGVRKVEEKIKRTIELQASQVLQTGIVSLVDAAGTVRYTIDYKPKSTHFPTAGVTWSAVSDILGDLESLAEVIRDDGLRDPLVTVWGVDAFEMALTNAAFLARFDTRRINMGAIEPMVKFGNGGQFRGTVEIGTYKLDIWTYGARYKHPNTGTITRYVSPEKVTMMSPDARLDATFGAIPRIVRPDSRVLPFLPSRISAGDRRMDMFVNAWVSDDGENLSVGVGSRPLIIPTAIDTFGCIDSGL